MGLVIQTFIVDLLLNKSVIVLVEIFENSVFVDPFGDIKMELFEKDDVIVFENCVFRCPHFQVVFSGSCVFKKLRFIQICVNWRPKRKKSVLRFQTNTRGEGVNPRYQQFTIRVPFTCT